MAPVAAALLGALVTGGAAFALSVRAAASVDQPSRWVSRPVVTALGVLSGLVAGLRMETWAEAGLYLATAVTLALLFATDLAAQLIPHRIMWPGMLAVLVGLGAAALITGQPGRLGRAVLTGLGIMVVYFVIGWFGKGRFGLGDVSLSLLMGTFLGWLGVAHAVAGALLAFLVYVPVAVWLLLARRAGRTTEFAFGPCMIVATWLAAFWGPYILSGWAR